MIIVVVYLGICHGHGRAPLLLRSGRCNQLSSPVQTLTGRPLLTPSAVSAP